MKQLNKLLLLMVTVLMLGSSLNAQTITIGATGATVSGNQTASPINNYYESLRYQTVYTAAEIIAAGATSGSILQIGFDVTGAPGLSLPNYTIQMKNTTATDAAVHDATGLMQVYNTASYSPVAGGFDMLTLQTPFPWNGTDNILVDICFAQAGGWSSTGQVNVFTAANGGRFIRNDNSSQCGVTTSTTLGEKPVVQLVLGTPPACAMTSIPSFTNLSPTATDAAWTHPGTPNSYIIEYGPQGFTPGTGTFATSTTTTYSMTTLTSATDYMFRVQAVCGTAVGDTSFAAIGSFATDCPTTLTAPFTENFGGGGIPCLTATNGNLTSGGGWPNVGWIAGSSTGGYSAATGYDDNDFLFFETRGASTGDTDTLSFLSIDLTTMTAPLMDFFWYLDYQWSTSGSFDVQIQDAAGNWTSKFTRSGGQNTFDWAYASIDLSTYAGTTIGLRIIGEASAGYTGGAAIDNIRVKEAPVTACVMQASPLMEGFESGGVMNPCWEQSTMDNLDWTVLTGATGTQNTGPSASANGSYYAYIESSPATPGDSAILMSPPINTDSLIVPAIYFNYHMFGNDYMRLRVEYEVFGSEIWNTVWEQTGQVQTSAADDYIGGYIPLPAAAGQAIRVRFIGVVEANDGVSTGSGTGFTSDIAIDDIRIDEVISDDIAITNITTPNNGCELGIEAVVVELTNRGFNDQTGVPVFLSVNGGAAVGTTSGTILGNNGVGTVTVMVDMSSLGAYDIVAFSVLGEDEFTSNDTMMAAAYTQPEINTDYNEEFEMGDGYWYATGDWENGMPSGTVISNAGAGANAFVTNLSGNYSNAKTSYLYTPCFDISGMTSPRMRFSINWDYENDYDGAWLEYSVNDGASWSKLGSNSFSGQSWYNDTITNNNIGAAWSGTGTDGSNGWLDAIIDLQGFGLTTGANVKFRFVSYADEGSVNKEGLGIDNFGIFDGCISAVLNEMIVNESVDGSADGSITLNPVAGFGNYTYVWSNGATTNSISGLAPGNYDVTVTDGVLNCPTTETFTITSLCPTSLGLATTIANEIGDGEANGSALVSASAGTAPYAYSWSNGSTQDNTFDLTGGTYTVVVTDASGCMDSIDAVIATNYLIGTENIDGLTGLSLSPNPAKDYAQLDINFANSVDLTVALVDVTGRVLETRNQGNTTSEQMRFDVNNLAEGVYFLKITANGQSATKRFVVVK